MHMHIVMSRQAIHFCMHDRLCLDIEQLSSVFMSKTP